MSPRWNSTWIEELGRRIGCVSDTERIGHKRHMVLVSESSDSPVQHVGNLNTALPRRHSRPSFRNRGGRDENLGSCRNKFFLCPLLMTIQCHVSRSAPNPGNLSLLSPQYLNPFGNTCSLLPSSCIHHRRGSKCVCVVFTISRLPPRGSL
jgi:hypothetical protein